MPTPNCPKCGGTKFIVSHVHVPALTITTKTTYLVVCSSCGCVVGAVSK